MRLRCATGALAATLLALASTPATARTSDDDQPWLSLVGEGSGLAAFGEATGAWRVVGSVALAPDDSSRLASEPGDGVIVNDPPGRTRNLITEQEFGDLEAHIEFLVPERSNSGVKFMGLYEIQIYDSHGRDPITATGNGGIYPRAELLPTYRRIDDGIPPAVNASKPAGQWQTLEVIFRAPRFDDSGQKVAHARFERVVLNGHVIHEDVEIAYPTGHAWRIKPEVPRGPLLFQADHGPVAFRAIRVRSIDEPTDP